MVDIGAGASTGGNGDIAGEQGSDPLAGRYGCRDERDSRRPAADQGENRPGNQDERGGQQAAAEADQERHPPYHLVGTDQAVDLDSEILHAQKIS